MLATTPLVVNSTIAYATVALTTYTALCHWLRFRRCKSIARKYGFGPSGTRPLSDITDAEALEIQRELATLEFPALFEKGLQLALFRTYGIPTISKLLFQTAQLSTRENVGKRYADTTILVAEIYDSPPGSERGLDAVARLNYLHGHYIKQGRITNNDMLYTLALFMNHPREWIDRYEWRTLTDLEVCALGIVHKTMGDGMNISFDVLPSSKTGWKDGLHFYRELDVWAKEYELKNLVPHLDNYRVAIKTVDLFLTTVPRFTHPLVKQVLRGAMDDRLREAIMLPPAHPIVKPIFETLLSARRFFLRHLTLPRPNFLRLLRLSEDESPQGRRWITLYTVSPHYIRPTWWNRWGPGGFYQLLIGAPRPGDPGMIPEGYLRANVGPRAFEDKGQDAMAEEKVSVRKRTGGCPFDMSRS